MELFADRLEERPLVTRRLPRREADAREPGVVAEISDVGQRDLPAPEVAWESLMWWKAGFGEVPVPLRPSRLFAVSEVQALDDAAALPSVVCRVGWLVEDVGPSRNVPEPGPGDGRRVDVEQR